MAPGVGFPPPSATEQRRGTTLEPARRGARSHRVDALRRARRGDERPAPGPPPGAADRRGAGARRRHRDRPVGHPPAGAVAAPRRPGHPRPLPADPAGRAPSAPGRRPAGHRARGLDRLRPQRRVRLVVRVPRAAAGRPSPAGRAAPLHAAAVPLARPGAGALAPPRRPLPALPGPPHPAPRRRRRRGRHRRAPPPPPRRGPDHRPRAARRRTSPAPRRRGRRGPVSGSGPAPGPRRWHRRPAARAGPGPPRSVPAAAAGAPASGWRARAARPPGRRPRASR